MESNTSNYEYPISKIDHSQVTRRIYTDSNRLLFEIFKDGKTAIFKPTLNLRMKSVDIAKGKETCSQYGEFIAHMMLKKMGIQSCKVEMVTRHIVNPRSKSRKGNDVPGAISYYELGPGEILIPASTAILRYLDQYNKMSGTFNSNNIETVIAAFMYYANKYGNASEDEKKKIKQSIIEMTMFDCRCANRDRHDENYGLALKDGTVRFYPLFDNEYILGFSETTTEMEKNMQTAFGMQEHISKDLWSVMSAAEKQTNVSSSSMLAHLFAKYPDESRKAYEKIMSVSEADLYEIMNECENLPDRRKEYAMKIFRIREQEIKMIYNEYIGIPTEKPTISEAIEEKT